MDAPANLESRGLKFWQDATGVYEFRADELLILEDACRELDVIDRLEEELRTADLLVKGSMGQDVANPLLGEVRQHRALYARLVKQLALPDGEAEADQGAGDRSSKARSAANARWRRGA